MSQSRILSGMFMGCALWMSVRLTYAQDSSLGVYAGAGVGPATIRQDPRASTGDIGLSHGSLGWDIFLGVRPSRYLGAEVEYFSFGKAHRYVYTPTAGTSSQESRLQASSSAVGGFAVGYLPLEPWWDFYAKTGIARLHND